MHYNLATKIFFIGIMASVALCVLIFFIGCIIENHLPHGQFISDTESLKFIYDLFYSFSGLSLINIIGAFISVTVDNNKNR